MCTAGTLVLRDVEIKYGNNLVVVIDYGKQTEGSRVQLINYDVPTDAEGNAVQTEEIVSVSEDKDVDESFIYIKAKEKEQQAE